jgi:hypothetical protein
VLFVAVSATGEFDIIDEERSNWFWIVHTFGGILSFAVVISVFFNVKYGSRVLHNLAGAIKSILQIGLAGLIFTSDTMGLLKLSGIGIIIVFSAVYAYVVGQDSMSLVSAKPVQETKMPSEEEEEDVKEKLKQAEADTSPPAGPDASHSQKLKQD